MHSSIYIQTTVYKDDVESYKNAMKQLSIHRENDQQPSIEMTWKKRIDHSAPFVAMLHNQGQTTVCRDELKAGWTKAYRAL